MSDDNFLSISFCSLDRAFWSGSWAATEYPGADTLHILLTRSCIIAFGAYAGKDTESG